MAGVDLRTVQEPGGWKTLSMVQRYAHLAPERLVSAVERLVSTVTPSGATTLQLRQIFGDGRPADAENRAGVS